MKQKKKNYPLSFLHCGFCLIIADLFFFLWQFPPSFASRSASSLPWMLQCEGIHCSNVFSVDGCKECRAVTGSLSSLFRGVGSEMFTKFRIGESSVRYCGTSPLTVEHFPQDCQTHQHLRAETWPADTPVREKIYSPVENLQRTAAYVRSTRVPVWANDDEEEGVRFVILSFRCKNVTSLSDPSYPISSQTIRFNHTLNRIVCGRLSLPHRRTHTIRKAHTRQNSTQNACCPSTSAW